MQKVAFSDNKINLYCCDNLDLMATILDNTVDLIYCDILYGTGRKFRDYQDLKPDKKIIEEHYVPRIKEMWRILKNTGGVYLQMDTKINHWVRCILDNIFGYNNFRNEISWCYLSGGISKKDFPKKHDVILWYSKTNKYIYNKQSKPYSEKTLQRGLTKCKGNYKLFDEGTSVVDWWDDITPLLSPTCYERIDYDTQKPKALIERIITASSDEGDLVADFYSGSFTTAEVCLDLNRNFIGCDIGQKAYEIGKNRIEKLLGQKN